MGNEDSSFDYARNCDGSCTDSPDKSLSNNFSYVCSNIDCGAPLEKRSGGYSTAHLHKCNKNGTFTGNHIKTYQALLCMRCNNKHNNNMVMKIRDLNGPYENADDCFDITQSGEIRERNRRVKDPKTADNRSDPSCCFIL